MRRVFLSRVRSRYLLAASAVPAVGIVDAPKESSALNQVLRSLTLTPLLVLTSLLGALAVSAPTAWAGGDANRGAGECTAAAEAAPGFSQLPDCRGYELVTPPLKNSSLFAELYQQTYPEVASDGSRLTAEADQCLPQSESCVPLRYYDGDPYSLTRTPGGWVTTALAPPASEFETDSYYTVDPDTGMALFSAPGSPEGADNFYSRSEEGAFTDIGPLGENKSLLNEDTTCVSAGCVESTENFSHVVYDAHGSLWHFDKSKGYSLYEYSGTGNTEPMLVGVSGPEGSKNLVSKCETRVGGGEDNLTTADNALSEDGRIVYFAAGGRDGPSSCTASPAEAPATYQLWARIDGELPDAHSVLISAPAEKSTSGPGEGCETAECKKNTTVDSDLRDASFEGASRDGSKVVFTDTGQLTDGASEDTTPPTLASASIEIEGCSDIDEPGGCNLYESVCAEPCATGNLKEPEAQDRELIDIDDPDGTSKVPGGPRVQGVMAVSADGSHVYFVAKGVLTGEEQNDNGEQAVEEDDNLYVYSAGRLTFIARLAPTVTDELQWGRTSNIRANVTPDGQFLVFEDDGALTADDTRPEGEEAAQVYEYDAANNHLTRISAGENGFDDDGNGETGNAAIVEASRGGAGGPASTVPLRQDATMSDNGALVFFESPVALTPGALGDVRVAGAEELFAQNVYEYNEGHVYLISDGHDTTGQNTVSPNANGGAAGLTGVSSSGADVFFSTFDSLVPQDTDTQLDFYDAHICSEASPCIPPPAEPTAACEGEACQGPPRPSPVFGAPGGTATFSGAGNLAQVPAPAAKPKTAAQLKAEKLAKALRVCKKDKKKSNRAKCEKQARKQWGTAKQAKRAASDRRGS